MATSSTLHFHRGNRRPSLALISLRQGLSPGIIGVMPLLGRESIRALAYVDALTSQGVYPTSEDVNAFIEARSSIWDDNPNLWGVDSVQVTDYLLDARLLRPRVLGVMSREVVESAGRCRSDCGVLPVVIVEVDPAG